MSPDSFHEEDSTLLTPETFAFVLDNELNRAVRSQSFLTLVVVQASRESDGVTATADSAIVHEIAQMVSREVRGTDVIGHTEQGVLSLVLLDAPFAQAAPVIDRLAFHIESSGLPATLRIAVGAASFPLHAVDATSLKEQAMSRRLASWRGGTRNPAPTN